jgi:hypothetical protein
MRPATVTLVVAVGLGLVFWPLAAHVLGALHALGLALG